MNRFRRTFLHPEARSDSSGRRRAGQSVARARRVAELNPGGEQLTMGSKQ